MALIYAIIESNVSCFMNRPCVFQQLDACGKITTTGILSGMWLMANGIVYYDYYAVGNSLCQPRRLCQSRASAKQAQGTSLFVGHTNTVARGDTF